MELLVPKATALKNRSEKIMNVFTKTATDLTKVNEEITAEKEVKQAKIDLLLVEQRTLTSVFTANKKMADKILDFLA